MVGSGGFQQQVYNQPIMAVAGDFASVNPYYSFDAGPGGLVAGPDGVSIGRFAWVTAPLDPNGTGQVVNNSGIGPVDGFVHRAQQGLITTYLANAGILIPEGFQMGLVIGGDFWCINDGAGAALNGMKAFAKLADGKAQFAAAGTVIGGASATGSDVAAGTFSTTASISDDVMTVTAVGSGTVYPGGTISGTGVVTGTKVVRQLTGIAGSTGTYLVSIPQSVSSTTIAGTYGILTIGTATGTFQVGDVITGSGISVLTSITANISGSGGTGGTMVVDVNTVVGSTTITASHAIETKWYARSYGAAGELVKISSQPLG
jgi:hypothetical protein